MNIAKRRRSGVCLERVSNASTIKTVPTVNSAKRMSARRSLNAHRMMIVKASVCEKGACVAAPKTCQIDQECGEGKICKDKVCAAPDCAADQDCGADQACQDQRCVPLQAEAAGEGPCADKDGKLWAAVPFAFNLGDLSAEAKLRLDRIARCLTALESAELGIVGHADERGTQEYNLHLGERRAQAIKRYLVNLGVDEKKLSVISYGEERPVAEGSDESSWQKHRRAEFKRP